MTNLPEPNFIERNPDLIIKEWIEKYEQKSGKILQPAQIERLIIDLGAYRETILRNKIQEIAKQNLLSYAPIDVLEHIGEPLGVKKLLKKCAQTTLKFSVEEALEFDYLIPAGTQVETRDSLYIFKTLKDGILKANTTSVEISAESEIAGIGTNNYIIGSINNLITPLKYVSTVENTVVSYGGADDEEEESLRERIRQAPEKFSNAGSYGAYRYHTFTAHQSIIDVEVLSPSPGVVNIYPLTEDGITSNEVLSIVAKYYEKDGIRPLTDYVEIIAPEKIDFEIKAKIVLYQDADIASVQNTVDAKLKEYKIQLSQKLGKNVVNSQIRTILNSIYGVYDVLELTPQNIDVKKNQWANLKSFNVSIGGYADE